MAGECCRCGLALGLDRPPEVLPCGHTSCLTCVEDYSRGSVSETRCPRCSKKMRQESAENGAGFIQELAISAWCLECDSPPTPRCLRDHTFCNAARLVHEAAKYADSLHDAVIMELQRAWQGVETLRTWTNAAACREDLLAVRSQAACADRIRSVLHQAAEQISEEVRRCQPECEGGAAAENMFKTENGEPQDAPGEMRNCDVFETDVQEDALSLGPDVIFPGYLKQEHDEPVSDTSHLSDHTYSAGVHGMSTYGVDDMNAAVSLYGISHRVAPMNDAKIAEITPRDIDMENTEVNVISLHTSEIETDTDKTRIDAIDALHGADTDSTEISHEDYFDTNLSSQCLNKVSHSQSDINMDIAGLNEVSLNVDAMKEENVGIRETGDQGAEINTECASTNKISLHDGPDMNRGNIEVNEVSVRGICEDNVRTLDGACWIETLPDSLLDAVLAYVPTTQLLSLRLLGRRWSRRLLAPSVWRHRRLSIPAGQDTAPLAAILRLAPALDRLVLKMSHPPLRGLVGLRALADGRCKIRSLHLTYVASSVSNRFVKRALGHRCYSLQALSICITPCCRSSDLLSVLKDIDMLKGLRTLKLSFGSFCPTFWFRSLRLENLILSEFVLSRTSAPTCRSIIMSSKDTLLEVKVESCEPFLETLQHCTKLDTLSVASCTGLAELIPRLPAIQWVRIADLLCPSALSWLRWTRSDGLCVSVKTHVNVALHSDDHFLHLLDLAGVLGNVHSMACRGTSLRVPPALVERLLEALPVVETLVLDVATDYAEVLRGWSAATAPALEELSVRAEEPSTRSYMVRELNIRRPSLELRFL